MSAVWLNEWFGTIQALGWTLLHFLWQGCLIGALYALARFLIGPQRAQWRYAAGLAALAALVVAPVATFLRLFEANPDSIAPAMSAALPTVGAQVDDMAAASSGIEPWLPWLVGAWLVGVCLVSLRALAQYWILRRLCRQEAQPLPEWDATLKRLCQRFGVSRPVRLVKSAIVQTPSLIGWLAPVIVLPASVLVGLSPKQIELVIAHELGHIRRWDYAVNLLQIAVESVLFYHPVVHWISREVRNEREACCDDLVLRLGANPVDYAETLASLEELRGVTHAPAVAASGGFLLGRIRRIVGVEPLFSAPLSGGQGVLALALAFAAFLAVRPVTTDVLGLAEPSASEAQVMPVTTTVAHVAAATVMQPLTRIEQTIPPTAAASVPQVAEQPEPATAAPVAERSAPAALPRIANDLRAERPELASSEPEVSDIAPAVLRAKPDLSRAGASDARTLIIKRVAPAFPRHARLAGMEGYVSVSFTVDAFGMPQGIQVTEAYPQRVFNSAAVAAMREWRFNPDLVQGNKRYAQTFDFSLTDHPRTPVVEAEQPCTLITGSRICRRGGDALEAGISPRVVIENPRETLLPGSGMRLGGPGK